MQVDRRHLEVVKDARARKKPGAHYTDTMRAYWYYLVDGNSGDPDVDYAASMYASCGVRRAIMVSLLLGAADPADILTVFDVPVRATQAFKELFFDSSVFKTRLDRLEFLETMRDDPVAFEMAKRACAIGPEFIYFTYGNHMPSTEAQKHMVKKLYMTSAYKAMESMFNSPTSKVSAASRDYAKLMLKAYETIDALLSSEPDDGMSFVKVLVQRDLDVAFKLSGSGEGAPDICAKDII